MVQCPLLLIMVDSGLKSPGSTLVWLPSAFLSWTKHLSLVCVARVRN